MNTYSEHYIINSSCSAGAHTAEPDGGIHHGMEESQSLDRGRHRALHENAELSSTFQHKFGEILELCHKSSEDLTQHISKHVLSSPSLFVYC